MLQFFSHKNVPLYGVQSNCCKDCRTVKSVYDYIHVYNSKYLVLSKRIVYSIYIHYTSHPITTNTAIVCAVRAHCCTDTRLPFVYLGWGQGFSPHPQLGAAVHAERHRASTQLETTTCQCMQHILDMYGRKWRVGTVGRRGESLMMEQIHMSHIDMCH